MTSAPENPQQAIRRGRSLIECGEFTRAIDLLSRVAAEEPDLLEAHGMLGNAYAMAAQWDRAIAAFRRTVELNPTLASAHFGLGSALANQGRIAEAITSFGASITLGYHKAHCNLGVALAKAGRYDAALAELYSAISLNPGDATAHWNLSLLLLMDGKWREGFAEYEWRLRSAEFSGRVRNVDRPRWNGQDLRGRTILVHDEQGYGDAILFARYVPLLAQRGARVVLLCQKPLARLLRRVAGACLVFSDGEPAPNADLHVPIGSLPLALGAAARSQIAALPYLSADPQLVEAWSKKLPTKNGRMRVGIAWQGNLKPDPARSIDACHLSPLLGLEGVQYFGVHKSSDARNVDGPPGIFDCSGELSDFAATAALMANLDLVISIDTAAAHLAGAMGIETWTLLPHQADWRWLRQGQTTPWFARMRLFRQPETGDWPGVIHRVAAALAEKLPARHPERL